jgi:hypothetical protein
VPLRASTTDTDHHDEVASENIVAGTARPSASWDVSELPVFARDRQNRPRTPSPVAAPRPRSNIQRKLAIGPTDDPREHEADRVADEVMRMPDPAMFIGAAPPQISRKCAACNEEGEDTEKRQMKPATASQPQTGEAPGIVHEVVRSHGQPLDAASRDYFEPRFGHDFSGVRVHTDDRAAESAVSIGASAYTAGSNIAFAAGRYDPATSSGRRLLAHELAHVVQQSGREGIRSSSLQRQPSPSTEAPAQGSQATEATVPRPRITDKSGYTFREKISDEGQPVLYTAKPWDKPEVWARDFLEWCVLDWVADPTGEVGQIKYVLRHIDDKFYTPAGIRDTVVAEAAAEGLQVAPEVAEAAAAALLRPITSTSKKDDSTQLVISWTFVPKQISSVLHGGTGTTTSNPIIQIQGQYTWVFHKDDDPGFELSAIGQAQFTKDPQTKRVTEQHMVGAQAAAVSNFFTNFIQVGAVADALGGATFIGDDPVTGSVTCWRNLTSVQATAQAAIGVQSVFTIPGIDKPKLQIVLQAQGGITDTNGLVTFDMSKGIGIQYQF